MNNINNKDNNVKNNSYKYNLNNKNINDNTNNNKDNIKYSNQSIKINEDNVKVNSNNDNIKNYKYINKDINKSNNENNENKFNIKNSLYNINDSKNNYENNPCELKSIKSTLIIKRIFEYIGDENFKYKLFSYSKLYQKIFNIELDDYIYQYLYNKKYERIYYNSPLFKKIISEDTIYLYQNNIKKNNNLSSDFDKKLDETKQKYLSLYYLFNNNKCIDDLKKFKID